MEKPLMEVFETVFEGLNKMDTKLNYLIVKADKQDNTIEGLQTTIKEINSHSTSTKKDDFDIKQVLCEIDSMKKDITYMVGKFYNKMNYLESFIEKYDKAFKERNGDL